ncbi:uncharacterized protein LOC129765304 isoform X2 [Toxorhynchites rutilus septentrionalis]|uniref:uncharacterized protein LOC129765304 isoform X2 n=1 Tax=Toxorhynchites rutilus septentrionalis TaxID=329112 RepID=UPI0024792712|nr:uncharacterized protein LOC129765304 isoform X2 [Toxorhynchites rutilus septentrionalis]XP_055621444.1 uncharacterized protein LOC129765304 isoform X2 [Toxorhynchites rutilus septentrionalis]XP_055621445.1 uncharacterized protein LOC129765304 isoform X2 [Toxorhynchites rutilus septentrionalis]
MLGALRRRWRTTRRSVSTDNQYDVDRDGSNEIIPPPRYVEFLKAEHDDFSVDSIQPPRYIEVRRGRIVLESGKVNDVDYKTDGKDSLLRLAKQKLYIGSPTTPEPPYDYERSLVYSQPQSPVVECGKPGSGNSTSSFRSDSCKNTDLLEARIAELEDALLRLQDRVNQSQCNSPTLEKEIKEHLEIMNKVIKTKDRKSMQVCREHKSLQVRFQRQENSLMVLQNENKSLHQRIKQYEACLDDIMRKVVDALVAEDSLRDEVFILKNRVRDLEAQNAALTASPAKSRDEGYCTMSSGQPQPSQEGHLEELPEEPEQWLVSAEPCTAEMEDWSMSQDELATALEDDSHDWIWNSSFLTSAETQTEDVSALLQEQIVYSDDEEVACTNFTRDFYRLVSIKSESNRSLQSPTPAETTISSSDENERLTSPTPSEAGRAQVHSCSSSESSDVITEKYEPVAASTPALPQTKSPNLCTAATTDLLQDVLITVRKQQQQQPNEEDTRRNDAQITSPTWRRSNGWRRISRNGHAKETHIPVPISLKDRLKSPPPVPVRRHCAS